MVISAIYWFLVALTLALTEIEVEGKFGWAEKTATWSRKVSAPKGFRLFSGSRTLTGYHLFLNAFLLILIHSPLIFFNTFSWDLEFQLIAIYLVWALFWDFLWFILNPYYGWAKFSPKAVWWFGEEPWIFKKLPIKYFVQIGISFILILASYYLNNSFEVITNHALTILLFVIFTILTHLFIRPIYHSYYWKLHKKVE